MKAYSRSQRVGEEILRLISGLLIKDIKDPRLEMVTLTGVKMSADLRHARIFFVMNRGKAYEKEVMQGFQSAVGFIKKSIARHIDLRYMPEIVFSYDPSFDYGSRIDALLNEVVVLDNGRDHLLPE